MADWRLRTIGLLWAADVVALLLLSVPFTWGSDYEVKIGDFVYSIPFRSLISCWLICTLLLLLVTWIWLRPKKPRP